MSAKPTPRAKRTSPPLKLTFASAAPLAALLAGKLLCRLGAPLVNIGWQLREWALDRLTTED